MEAKIMTKPISKIPGFPAFCEMRVTIPATYHALIVMAQNFIYLIDVIDNSEKALLLS